MNMSTSKKCSTRDAATATLRKLGVAKADYDDFIVKRDGTFYVDTMGAEKHAAKSVDAKPKSFVETTPAKKSVTKAKPAAKVKVAAESNVHTCSTVSRTLIRNGKTNQEVWDVISVEFGLDAKKRGYPAWYRASLRHAGEAV